MASTSSRSSVIEPVRTLPACKRCSAVSSVAMQAVSIEPSTMTVPAP